MKKSGMMAAVAAAAGLEGDDADKITMSAEFLAEHFPTVAEALRKQGAEAERVRQAEMDKLAVPGHETLVAAHKADASKSPGDLAMAIVAAEKTQRDAQLQNLRTEEESMRGLRNAPPPAGAGPTPQQASAHDIAARATEYINEQAKKGIVVSAMAAVAHVRKAG